MRSLFAPRLASRNETKMRHRRSGTGRNRSAGPGTPSQAKTAQSALDREINGLARNEAERARLDSNQ